jgi:hypothetical protein
MTDPATTARNDQTTIGSPVRTREAGDRGTAPPTLRESKTALLDAANAAVKEQEEKARRGTGSAARPKAIFWLVMSVLVVAAVALLVAQPEWLAGPRIEPEAPEIQEASATMALIEAASRVQSYRTTHGKLPRTLGEAGVANADVQYRKTDSLNFTVTIPSGDTLISLRSTDSLRPLAMKAIRVLQRRS